MHLAAHEPRLSCGVIYYGFPANPNLSANRPSEPLRETSLMNMPLLGFWGDQDQGVGMDNVERLERQLELAGKAYEFHIYAGLGHGFLTFDETNPAFEKSVESWTRAEAFFAEQLA
jgi:carboxymethylenebutenolidase